MFMKNSDLDINVFQKYVCAIQMHVIVKLWRMQKFITQTQFL